MRIDQYVSYYARNHGDVACIKLDEVVLSYEQFDQRANQMANGLAGLGVNKGDVVAIYGKNSIEHALLMTAVARIGAVALAINSRLTLPELNVILEDAQPKALVTTDPEQERLLRELNVQLESNLVLFTPVSGVGLDFGGWLDSQSSAKCACELTDDDPFLLFYTSGTTGKPKGVLSSHRNVMASISIEIAAMSARPSLGDRELTISPLFHVGGAASILVSLCCGQSIVLHRQFSAKDVVAALTKERINSVFLVPTMISTVLETPGVEQMSFPDLRQIAYGASPITESLLRRAQEVFDVDFVQLYGMTETTGSISTLSAGDHKKALKDSSHLLRSCGRPGLGADMKVISPEGRELPAGETGEICVRSESNMLRYHGLPEATAM